MRKQNRVIALFLTGALVFGSTPAGVLGAEPIAQEVQVEAAESQEIAVGDETPMQTETSTPTPTETSTPTPTPIPVPVSKLTWDEPSYDVGKDYYCFGETIFLPKLNTEPQNATEEIEYTVDPAGVGSIRTETGGIVLETTPDYSGQNKTITVTARAGNTSSKPLKIKMNPAVEAKPLVLKEGSEGTIDIVNYFYPEEKSPGSQEFYPTKDGYCELLSQSPDEPKTEQGASSGSEEGGESTALEKDKLIIDESVQEDNNATSQKPEKNVIALGTDGTVQALAAGTATVRVYAGEYTRTCYTDCAITVEHNWEIGEVEGKTASITCKHCEGITGTAEITDTIQQSASCTEPSKNIYTVNITLADGRTYQDVKIETAEGTKQGHKTLKLVKKKAASCAKTGNLAYYYCDRCKGYFKDKNAEKPYEKNAWVIPKTAHKKDKGTITAEATAAKEGVRTYRCTMCKKKLETYKIPRTSFSYTLGTKGKSIVSKVSDFKSIAFANGYAEEKKAVALDAKTWKLSTKKNSSQFYKSMKSFIPLVVTTKYGKKYTVKVKFEFPKPQVKITRTTTQRRGISAYEYRFTYDIPGATRILVRLKTGRTDYDNACVQDFDKYISKPKSDSDSYILARKSLVDALGPNKMKFQITAYYGENPSKTITIVK